MELSGDSETGKILTEALDRYFSRQLNRRSEDTLLSQLLVPEPHWHLIQGAFSI